MSCRARAAILCLVAGFSLSVFALGCCCPGYRDCGGPVQRATCCPRCGRPLPHCDCVVCRLRWLLFGIPPAGPGTACAPRAMESPFPRFHPVPKWPVFSNPPMEGDIPAATAEPGALMPIPVTPSPSPATPSPAPAPTAPSPAPGKAPPSKTRPAPLPDHTPPAAPRTTDGWRPIPAKTVDQADSAPSWVFRPVSHEQQAVGSGQ